MSNRRLKRSRRAASAPPTRKSRPVKPARLDLGVLDGHLGYFIRRLQVWVFQDFIRTLAAIDIRPAQYSVLVVITANPGASQSQIAATLALIYPPGIGVIVPGERWDERAQPMLDYFRAFEESFNRFPGFNYEVQGVFQERVDGRIKFHTYVVREGRDGH